MNADDSAAPQRGQHGWNAWGASLSAGLCAGALAAGGRLIVFRVSELAAGREELLVDLALGNLIAPVLMHGLVAGLVAGVFVALVAARSRLLAGAAAVVTLAPVAAGWTASVVDHPTGITGEPGALQRGGLLLVAAVIGLLLPAAVAALRSRPVAAGIVSLVALACALVAPQLHRATTEEILGWMSIDVPVHDLLAGGWTVVRGHPDLSPSAEVICPSPRDSLDGSSMPALMLAPPAEVRIPIQERGVLHPRAGIHHVAVRRAPTEGSATVRFEVLVDDVSVFDGSIRLARHDDGSAWLDASGPEGLELRPGQVVTLRTELNLHGGSTAGDRPIPAGFGGLVLERELTRPRRVSSPEAPNIVLVVMDTQRADRLSAYGYERPTSPHLEQLAARGVLYENAHSTSSWTWPATASLLTGLQPEEHGVLDTTSCYLAPSLLTLPEVLQRRGYTTIGWSSNPLIAPSRNFDQGFEHFKTTGIGFPRTRRIWSAVENRLRSMGDQRFFLYLHLVDTHAPYETSPEAEARLTSGIPPDLDRNTIAGLSQALLQGAGHGPDGEVQTDQFVSPELQRQLSELYDACTFDGDHWLGEVVRVLEEAGLSDRTVVAFTSDHGEEHFEHGLAAHGPALFQESVRVPLVLAGPGIPAGLRIDTPVSNAHLAATLARIGGAALPAPAASGDVIDLARPDPAGAVRAAPVFFSTHHGWWNGHNQVPLYALRDGDWILQYAPRAQPWGARGGPSHEETRLFHLGDDPGELVDVAAREEARAAAMLAELKAEIDEQQQRRTSPEIAAGEETLELLEDIGYIDRGDG